MTTPTLTETTDFSQIAADERIQRTVAALEASGIHALVAETAADAKRLFFELVPEGSEVFLGASVTLEVTGIKDEIDQSGRYDALRPRMFAMNRETQATEIRKLGAGPDFAAGSAQAVTEDGHIIFASMTGSQVGPYASGAGKVIWVIGAQKLVKDVAEGLRRIEEYCVPREEVHMQELYKIGTSLNKILIFNKEIKPGRATIIIVKEALGF